MGWLDFLKPQPKEQPRAQTPTAPTREAKPRENAVATAPAACPYCGVAFDSPPQRKRKCPDCGSVVFVRSHDGRKLLLTENGVAEYELQREKENQQALIEEGEAHYREFFEIHRSTLMQYKKSDVVKKVEVLSSGGCQECGALQGKRYSIDQALKEMPLPVKTCTYRKDIGTGKQGGWCRCCWLPVNDGD